jgi:putative FmdB family regulatory protein
VITIMPAYDYRCKRFGTRFELRYRTYAEYDAAADSRACPACGSRELDRLIGRVALHGVSEHDFAGMSSDQMLNVLEGGDRGEVSALMQQVGADRALDDPALRTAVQSAREKGETT